MAVSVVDAIGVVSGVLGVVSFIRDNIPERPKGGAAVQIKAGNPGDKNPGLVSRFSSEK